MNKSAFVIMQIGNPELDKLYDNYIKPAAKTFNLEAKRVDKHNEGRLLKSEIVEFIKSAGIIIADLTNERPNCYLEVGYAMGLDKFKNLILTVREDHHPDSPNYKKEGAKIHFDLSGYDILRWWPENLDQFKLELEKRIRWRLSGIPAPLKPKRDPWDSEWIKSHREKANKELGKCRRMAYAEFRMTLPDSNYSFSPTELRNGAIKAEQETYALPLSGIFNRATITDLKPTTEGISSITLPREGKGTFYYLAVRKDGSLYLMESLFEDEVAPSKILVEERIRRIAGVLSFMEQWYSALNIPADSRVCIGVRHARIKDRFIDLGSSRVMSRQYKNTSSAVHYNETETTFKNIKDNLLDLVEYFTKPIFELFDFFIFPRKELETLITQYTQQPR